MMKGYIFVLLFVFSLSHLGIEPLCADSSEPKVIVNNRVFLSINENPISVIDVMKKMDFMLYKTQPAHLDSPYLRYQFYMAYWKDTLRNVIDRELVHLDAVSQKMPISPGDIREEMEELFAPDLLGNLERANLSYEDATQLIKEDILIRRMLTFSVNVKAMRKVTPQAISEEYERTKRDLYQDLLYFRILNVKSADADKARQLADWVQETVNTGCALEEIELRAKDNGLLDDSIILSVSGVFQQKKEEFAPQVYGILHELEEGRCSSYTQYKGGCKLFFLEKRECMQPPSLSELENAIREMLTNKYMMEESDRYFAYLRKHYDVHSEEILDKLPDSFKPFELR